MELWHAGRRIRVAALRFGSQIRLRDEARGGRGYNNNICYSIDDYVLVGGSDDGTTRFWDARLFVTPEEVGPNIQMDEYSPPDTSNMTEDRQTWPAWWQETRIDVPVGFLPNPSFGRQMRVQEQKVICDCSC